MNNYLKQGLQELNLIDNSSTQIGNLIWVKDKNKYKNKRDKNSPYIYIALEKAVKYNVHGIYFRFFQDQRPPIPQIYIFDYTKNNLNEQDLEKREISELHKKLWNSLHVPLFYVFTKDEILIYNSYNQPTTIKGEIKYDLFEKIRIAAEIDLKLKEDFSAKNFDNGSFWESEKYRNYFDVKKNAYEKLISKLREVRQNLLDSKNIFNDKTLNDNERKSIIHKLLVMSILVKYLEEKKDLMGYTVFPKKDEKRVPIGHGKPIKYRKDFFEKYSSDQNSFVGLLENNGNIIQLFRDLSKHFNGEIFRLTEEEENQLEKINLEKFAEFFEAKTEKGGQGSFWKLYSFNDLPVELVSNIYEEFIEDKKEDGIVYTPPFLVNFLLEEVMPLNNNNTDFKILDPANGSGIFLVQAYKRLIYRWRRKNNWEPPKLKELKNLLVNNIYGVDLKEDAVRLTAFSLTLALCDELSPLEIWDDLQFDKLKGKNLFESDFFELINSKKLPTDFDLIIGNPPFNIKKSKFFEQFLKNQTHAIPDKNPALAFLRASFNLCNPNGTICMILPSGPFLYNQGSFYFRKFFIQNYNLQSIFDFTHLSRFLFGAGKGDHPTLAVLFKNTASKKEDILHITIRRTKTIKQKIWFELDRYDFHFVAYDLAISSKKEDKIIWKSNFIGGGRIHSIISRFAKISTLSDYIDLHKNWVYGEGFISGSKGRLKKAKFLSGSNFLPTKAFTENGIDENKIHKLEIKDFLNPKTPKLFTAPQLLIKEGIGKTMIAAFRSDGLSFKHIIVGIHSPYKDSNKLKQIEKKLITSKIYPFFVAGFSSQYLINKSTAILKVDIDNLPYPIHEKELSVSEIEEVIIDDTLDYFLEFRRTHSKLTAIEKESTSNQLNQFAKYYLKVLNSVYKTYKAADPIITSSNIIFPFYWGNKLNIPKATNGNLEQHLNQLLQRDFPEANLRFIRVMRIYDKNVIYLIKPKQLRYWLRSVAIRDADETFAYLVKQEYNV